MIPVSIQIKNVIIQVAHAFANHRFLEIFVDFQYILIHQVGLNTFDE